MLSNKTFLNLIEDSTILVPVIQRDYAQGRNDEKSAQIRDNFLTALVDQLCDHQKTKPLILDFVYGSLNEAESKEEKTRFLALDGQQRLTTLFLLHWYLNDNKEKELLCYHVNGVVRSKFSYQTRLSSKEFCDRLVEYSIDKLQGVKPLLSEKIKDQSWYRWDWSKDPTIDGMLVMLDAIDERLKGLDKDALWLRLKEGSIGFNLLYLHEFSLSDELYVKMNARGKELSEFDILKSTLEEQMRLNEVPEREQIGWRTNVDSCWIDLFWNIAKEKIGAGDKKEDVIVNVEQAYLRFIKRLFVYHLFINDDCLKNLNRQEVIREFKRLGLYKETDTDVELINKIRRFSVENDVLRLLNVFCKTGFFDASFFQFGIHVLVLQELV